VNALLAALAGGVVGLDSTSFPQAMISRPLVAGAIAGWLAGIPAEGAMLGAVLEAFHLAILPIGAARYPESGTATAAAVFAMAWAGSANGAAMMLAAMFALGWERLGGASVILLRHVNERIAPTGTRQAHASTITFRHGFAMTVDFVRGSIVTLAGAAAGMLWIRVLAEHWAFGPDTARGVLLASAAGCAAAALHVFGGWKARWRLFAAGAVAGTLMVLS
jgi:mannose/fructose/N-acetylgalactosamine-specific phosphotransferase system component IIC